MEKQMTNTTNIMLGGDDWEPEATTKAAYKWPDASTVDAKAIADKLRKQYYRAHFDLGADATEYTSSAADAFTHPHQKHPTRVGPVERALVTEAHFLIGGAEPEYTASTAAAYKWPKSSANESRATAAKLKKDLQSSHFELGADEHDWKTDTMRHFQGGQFKDGVAAENVRSVKVQTTLLRADNQDLPTHTFHEYRSSMMPDPRDTPGAYTGARVEAAKAKKRMKECSVMLGEDTLDYRSMAMMATGQQTRKLNEPPKFTIKGYNDKKK